MFWNKKKKGDKGLPDLPSTPTAAPSMRDFHTLIPVDKADEEAHALPSFPDSPMKKGFSQTAIKDAVESQEKELPQLPGMQKEQPPKSSSQALPSLPTPSNSIRKEKTAPQIYEKTLPPPQIPKRSKVVEMEEWSPQSLPATMDKPDKLQVSKTNKPIFVKIDKFRSARDSLEEIKHKLNTVDELLKTIREVKMQEEQEISSWEKDIESIKSRINDISSEIFDNALENS